MSLHHQSRWLLVVAVLAAWWTAAAVGRPADFVDGNHDSREPVAAENAAASVPNIRNVNSDGTLCAQLAVMTDRELDILEDGLSNIGAPAAVATLPSDTDLGEDEMMMGDMPSADAIAQDQSSASAQVTVRNDILFAERER